MGAAVKEETGAERAAERRTGLETAANVVEAAEDSKRLGSEDTTARVVGLVQEEVTEDEVAIGVAVSRGAIRQDGPGSDTAPLINRSSLFVTSGIGVRVHLDAGHDCRSEGGGVGCLGEDGSRVLASIKGAVTELVLDKGWAFIIGLGEG